MEASALRLRKGDIVVIIGVVLAAVLVFALFLPGQDAPAAYAQIYHDGQLIATVSLEEDQEFIVTGTYSNTVAIRDGNIAVIASSCPGEDCVGCGWIHSTGRSIVCLPNGLEIRVVSETADVDFVVG